MPSFAIAIVTDAALPGISVVVTCYNCRDYIGDAIRSVACQTLRDFEESPVLPTGYAGLIILALVPPLWFKVMDKRVLAHFDGDITRANIQPSKRAKVLKKYGAPETAAPEAAA